MNKNVSRRQWLSYWWSRWPLAAWLNRSRRTCWADLVKWALYESYGDPDEDEYHALRNNLSGGESCRQESAKPYSGGACYCGKFTNGCLTRNTQTPGDPRPYVHDPIHDPRD